jgi:phosphatidate cytidylyltransferase
MQLKTLLIRSASGFVYALVILLGILWGPMTLGVVLLLFAYLSLKEISNLISFENEKKSKLFSIVIGMSISILLYMHSLHYLSSDLLWISIGLLFLIPVRELFCHSKNVFESVASQFFSILYIVLPLGLVNYLFYPGDYPQIPQRSLLFAFFLFIWTNDTFAYLTGSLIGKHKLAKHISPKKTIEGSLGGLLFTIVVSIVFANYFEVLDLFQWIIFAVIIVFFGTFGDLFESMLKRNVGVKDSGDIMPGHGGILDRLDSVLMASPFIYLYLKLL